MDKQVESLSPTEVTLHFIIFTFVTSSERNRKILCSISHKTGHIIWSTCGMCLAASITMSARCFKHMLFGSSSNLVKVFVGLISQYCIFWIMVFFKCPRMTKIPLCMSNSNHQTWWQCVWALFFSHLLRYLASLNGFHIITTHIHIWS